ncbi:MAG: DUF4297 domain-containing protein [Proteobacteria bacterium]|nr:DUF4297 domain-containing protein [Pseudomonadota bacterium]
MPEHNGPAAPDVVAADGDPGDETARRYRFQSIYAAIVCCMMLDTTEDVVEVFCEHHEDVLVKHGDGTFSGLQVKTRASDQAVWKTSDKAVKGSCARFAKLEKDFPGCFRSYHFFTNHPLHSAKNGQDLRYVLELIKRTSIVSDVPPLAQSFLKQVAKLADCTLEVVFNSLSKTYANDSLPKLADAEVRLVYTLTSVWERAGECSYHSVLRSARQLIWECQQASSLAHQDVLPAYLPVTAHFEDEELVQRIAGKCVDRSRVLEILENGLNAMATLAVDPAEFTEPGAGKRELLLKKLDAGGFSAVSCNSAEDLRDKADFLGIVWTKKYGREPGLQRNEHVRSLVLSDAARVFEATHTEERSFGLDMLSTLRTRFQQRRDEGSQLYECSNEHLEGFAFSLTSQCKIQWSINRPWETE